MAVLVMMLVVALGGVFLLWRSPVEFATIAFCCMLAWTGVMLLLAMRAERRRKRAERQGFLVCPHCGYSLRGVESGRCPECGDPFTPESLGQWWNFWS